MMNIGLHHQRLLIRLALLLVPYTLLRVAFLIYHQDLFQSFSFSELISSFLMGVRFDIAAIILVNIPLITLTLCNTRSLKLERWLYIVPNGIAFLVGIDDLELFSFMGKRLGRDLFVIIDDIADQLPQLILNYWYFPIVVLAMMMVFWKFDKKLFGHHQNNPHLFPRDIACSVLILILSFIGIRGGLQGKSINVQTAFFQGHASLGHLTLNSPYHFIRTWNSGQVDKLKFFANDSEAIVLLNPSPKELVPIPNQENKPNIVLIILESFALEYFEQGFTPFLKSLAREGRFFTHHVANGRRSIEALPALLAGLPALMETPITKSIFQGNNFTGLPKLLGQHGYQSAFFHGGSLGTMGFESFTRSIGINRYYSRDDYPDQSKDFDGTWGIFDRPYLQFSLQEMEKFQQPFFAGIFTLSSHQPYAIPHSEQGRYNKGSLEIHESIGYVDDALREFFAVAKAMAWYQNTYFIITADHSQKVSTKKFQNQLGRFRVPLLIVGPGIVVGDDRKVTQHADIPKSILHLTGIGQEVRQLPVIGESVFVEGKGSALLYADGQYLLAEGDELSMLPKTASQGKVGSYNWETGELVNVQKAEVQKLKAAVQYYINGLLKNQLTAH